jgi:hypothetical protein
MTLVVVTGDSSAAVAEVAEALAQRLGSTYLSIAALQDELALEAEDTPREWLRLDAERELKRRVEAFSGQVVLDAVLDGWDDATRLVEVLRPWWADVVEVRCARPGRSGPSLGASRTVVLDGSRAPELGDLVSVVRGETAAVRRARRG